MAIDLSSYSPAELQDALHILRDYRNARKQIGNRAQLIDMRNPPEKELIIELTHDEDVQKLHDFLGQMITKYFPESSWKSPAFRINPGLQGGVRIFYGDDMVDITLERFAELLPSFSNL